MRLLDTKTLKLHEFWDDDIPPYAILSHTWERNEVSFEELKNIDPVTEQKEGYHKIKRCCEIADGDGFKYAWVDTCCIDKTSSNELSEAINSMYKWYQAAEVCYVYLSDYKYGNQRGVLDPTFEGCRWFTRGWTLQELISPRSVIFFNKQWEDIGTKRSHQDAIARITGIHVEALMGRKLGFYSHAQRMSWISKRQTTRTEDIAYCLLGIFEINMPLIYGEGAKAFQRLQEVIMSRSSDRSLFAWDRELSKLNGRGDLLARSPSQFASSALVRKMVTSSLPGSLLETEGGTHLELPSLFVETPDYEILSPGGTLLALLNCQLIHSPDRQYALKLIITSIDDIGTPTCLIQEVVQIEADRKNFKRFPLFIQRQFRRHYQLNHHETSLEIVVSLEGLQNFKLRDVLGGSVDSNGSIVTFPGIKIFAPEKISDKPARALVLQNFDANTCLIRFIRPVTESSVHGVHVMIVEVKGNGPDIFQSKSEKDTHDDRLYWQPTQGRWGLNLSMKRKRLNEQPVVFVMITEESLKSAL